jgi:mRNA-degrading endonuclease toxin of MazEF toxin-antitoxin module
MGRDVSDYVAGLEQTIAELKAKLELTPKASTLNLTSPEIVGNVETVPKPQPRRRTEQVANTE